MSITQLLNAAEIYEAKKVRQIAEAEEEAAERIQATIQAGAEGFNMFLQGTEGQAVLRLLTASNKSIEIFHKQNRCIYYFLAGTGLMARVYDINCESQQYECCPARSDTCMQDAIASGISFEEILGKILKESEQIATAVLTA